MHVNLQAFDIPMPPLNSTWSRLKSGAGSFGAVTRSDGVPAVAEQLAVSQLFRARDSAFCWSSSIRPIGMPHALNKTNTGEVEKPAEQRSNEMFGKKLVVTWMVGIASAALPAFSQSETLGKNEFSAQAVGSFVKSTTNNGIENKVTDSGGVLGSYRYFFNAHNGVEANYGYALNTQSYGLASGALGVKSYSHELSAAYVFRVPMRTFTPFVLAGAGGLIFDPKDFAGASSQARAAFVYGGGADFNLSHHVFVRAEYRGFVYNSPTFGLTGLAGDDRVTHRAEPSLGFGYRF